MNKKLGLAVVGLGMAAKPHALALKDLSHLIDVRGCFARSAASRQAFQEAYSFPICSDLTALADDPQVDAALIITPPNARQEIVELFASRGKHVLTEKPIERSAGNAERIVQTCEHHKVELGVVFQHRFRAASEKLALMISDGALGGIRLVRAEVPWWRDQAYYDEPGRGTYARDGGGVLISQAIHTLDLMLSMTGPVAAVQGLCATTPFHKMESEDVAGAMMEFTSGAVGSLFATTASFPGDAESLTFDCDLASAKLKSGVLTLHWRDGRIETFGEEATTGGGADPMAFPYDWHKSLIQDFAQSVLAGQTPRVTGRQTLEVHKLIAAIEASSKSGQLTKIKG